jgi:hypothetical protein
LATAGTIATGNKAAAIALTRGNRKLLLVGLFMITLSNWETFWINAAAFHRCSDCYDSTFGLV